MKQCVQLIFQIQNTHQKQEYQWPPLQCSWKQDLFPSLPDHSPLPQLGSLNSDPLRPGGFGQKVQSNMVNRVWHIWGYFEEKRRDSILTEAKCRHLPNNFGPYNFRRAQAGGQTGPGKGGGCAVGTVRAQPSPSTAGWPWALVWLPHLWWIL